MVRTDGYAYSRFIGLTWDGSGIADVGIDHASGITNKLTNLFSLCEYFIPIDHAVVQEGSLIVFI
jgi:hypothetical protein